MGRSQLVHISQGTRPAKWKFECDLHLAYTTFDEKDRLFEAYCIKKRLRAEQILKSQLQDERARKKLAKRSGGSGITEDQSEGEKTVNSEVEEKQQKEKLANEKLWEECCRRGAVRLFLTLERSRRGYNQPSVHR